MTTYLSIKECLARLPVRISERAFRLKVRATGRHYGKGRQMFLSEDDLAAVLDAMRPPQVAPVSLPRSTGRKGKPKSKVDVGRILEPGSASARVLALALSINAKRKQNAKSRR